MKKNKILGTVLNVLIVIFVLFAACITVISLSTKENGVANINGIIPFSIQTESMEPTINKGDLIITKKVNSTSNYEKNDIISFFSMEQEKVIIKTHRIVKINNNAGVISYVTKGDNNNTVDNQEVYSGDIVSVYDNIKIPYLGYVLDFLRSQVGFLLIIIIPLFIFFIYQLYKFIVIVVQMQHEKNIRNQNQ